MHYRLAFRFSIEGDLRFIAHRDTVRLFERALARAEIPARRSAGFNPRPRLSLPLPRSVGVGSRDELLIVELDAPLSADAARERLAAQMPSGLRILDAFALGSDDCTPRSATYAMTLRGDEAANASSRAAAFEAAPRLLVQRRDPKSGRTRPIDVRSFVTRMAVDDGRLTWTQTVSAGGTAKPSEVLEALGLDPRRHLHRIERVHVEYAGLKRNPSSIVP